MPQKNTAPHRIQNIESGGYILFPVALLKHEAVAKLSDRAFRALILIQSRFNGFNNGRIQVSARWLGEQMATQNFASLADAICELEHHGLIKVTFNPALGQREARKFRLTYASYGQLNNVLAATNEWQNYDTEKQVEPRAKRRKRKQNTVEACSAQCVEGASIARKQSVEAPATQQYGNKPVSIDQPVEPSSTNIVHHGRTQSRFRSAGLIDDGNAAARVRPGDKPDPYMDVDELRVWVRTRIEGVPGAQSQLAAAAKVWPGTLSKFLNGRGLPRHHRISVQEALPRIIGPVKLKTVK